MMYYIIRRWSKKHVYYIGLSVYQLYKNRHHGMAMLLGARATDDVGRDRPDAQQTLAPTPTLTMAVPMSHREAGLLLWYADPIQIC